MSVSWPVSGKKCDEVGRSVRSEETLQRLPGSVSMFLPVMLPLPNQEAQGT